ncbi:MAG: SoxR reducing system RseC family protein [Prevotellaceae bacterium]|nr:SoxR reducing system RseC family protein [Prevotellaceae bacterium]
MIEHTGIIKEMNGAQIQVLITQTSACSACHAKSACTAADKSEKIIDIESSEPGFKAGDRVIVSAQRALGLKAVLLVFVIPFLIILITLFILRAFVENEAVSGSIALAMLVPYYMALSFFGKRIDAKFKFYIKKAILE